jgi:hypothetical protein
LKDKLPEIKEKMLTIFERMKGYVAENVIAKKGDLTYTAERGELCKIFADFNRVEKEAIGTAIKAKSAEAESLRKQAEAKKADFDSKSSGAWAVLDSNKSLHIYDEEMKRKIYCGFVENPLSVRIYDAYAHAAEASMAVSEVHGSDKLETFFSGFYTHMKKSGNSIDDAYRLIECLKEKNDDIYLLFRTDNTPKLNADGSPLSLEQIFSIDFAKEDEEKLAEQVAATPAYGDA